MRRAGARLLPRSDEKLADEVMFAPAPRKVGMRVFQYEVNAEGKGVPVRRAFLAWFTLCVGVCAVSCALAAGCVVPARAHASAPGPGVEVSATSGSAVVDGAVADVIAGSAAAESAEAVDEEPSVASAVVGDDAGTPDASAAEGADVPDVSAPEGGGISGDADAVGDEGWKTQLGAWVLASNPDAVEAALQQSRTDVAQADADAAAAKAELAAASDRASAAIALALACLAAGLVMLAVGRVKSRSTR